MSSSAGHPVWLLAWVTLAIVLVIAVIMLIRMRRKGDAHPMRGQRTRSVDEMRDEA